MILKKVAKVEGKLREKGKENSPESFLSSVPTIVASATANENVPDYVVIEKAKQRAIDASKTLGPDKVFIMTHASVGDLYIEENK